MIQSKSIQVLKTFSKDELKQFSDFLLSPFFNKNKNLTELLNVLQMHHPEFEIENEYIYSKVYNGKNYNHNNLKKLLSELSFLINEFLIFSCFKKEKFQKEHYLLKEFEHRKLDNLFSLNCKRIEEDLRSNKLYATLVERSGLNDLKITFYQSRDIGFKELGNFTEKVKYSFIYLFDSIFAELQAAHTFERNFNIKIETKLSGLFLRSFDIKNFSDNLDLNDSGNKLIKILLNYINIIIDPADDLSFLNAKKLLTDFPVNSKEECLDITGLYDALINHCNQKIIDGNYKFRREEFEIYNCKFQLLLKFKLSYYINWAMFKNIVKNAIDLKETEWAEKFIKENIHFLPKEIQEDINNYLFAMIELKRENYEKALEYSSKVNINFHYQKTSVRGISLICFYELKAFEQAISFVDSFKHSLSGNNQLEINFKNDFLKFINIYSRMLKFKINEKLLSEYELKILKNDAIDLIAGKDWVIQKLTELEKFISGKSKKISNSA